MTNRDRNMFLAGFYAGFMESGEGYNGEIPFGIRHAEFYDREMVKIAKEKYEEYVQRSRSTEAGAR